MTEIIKKCGSNTSYVWMEQVQNGVLYVKYRCNFTITTAERYRVFKHKTLHCSVVKAIPKVLLSLLKFAIWKTTVYHTRDSGYQAKSWKTIVSLFRVAHLGSKL